MGRPLIDRLSDPVRRHVMTSLFYAPSLGALALAGGLIPAAAVSSAFAYVAVYSYFRLEIENREMRKEDADMPSDESLGLRIAAPTSMQKMLDDICRKFGIAEKIPVFLYNNFHPSAFVTSENEIGFTDRAFFSLELPEMEWVMSHEAAHIEKGDTKINHAMLRVSRCMERFAAGIGGASAFPAMGMTNPVVAAITGLSAVFAVLAARQYVDAYESRSKERRRDYEAMQKTGNLDAAISATHKLEEWEGRKNMSLKQRWLHTHPVGEARIRNITIAYQDGLKSGAIKAPAAAPLPA